MLKGVYKAIWTAEKILRVYEWTHSLPSEISVFIQPVSEGDHAAHAVLTLSLFEPLRIFVLVA